jgi:GMP synthase (glutamine-hydrolysing)
MIAAAARLAWGKSPPFRAHFRSASSRALRILVVDGYAQKSRDEFAAAGLPLASSLYEAMLRQQAPREMPLEFDTVYPCAPDYKDLTDAELSRYDGCAFTGSSYSAYGQEADVLRQVELMRQTFRCGVSSFGSCWGIQIAAVALGGAVELNPRGREVGIGRTIALTPEGRGHPMFAGKKACFQAYESHGDEVTRLPPGALVLASNDHSRVQAMSVVSGGTESWFVQYHPEYDLDYYAGLIATRVERMCALGFFADADAVGSYVDDLRALHAASVDPETAAAAPTDRPPRLDLRWRYGIDDDVLNDDVKRVEVRNWLRMVSASASLRP